MCNTDREVLSACRAARAAPYRAGRRPTPQRTRPTPQRARSVPRRARGGTAARRPGAPSAPLRRPSPQPGAYLCAAPRGRGARAEHLTVSIAHGSLTRRPFLQYMHRKLAVVMAAASLPVVVDGVKCRLNFKRANVY